QDNCHGPEIGGARRRINALRLAAPDPVQPVAPYGEQPARMVFQPPDTVTQPIHQCEARSPEITERVQPVETGFGARKQRAVMAKNAMNQTVFQAQMRPKKADRGEKLDPADSIAQRQPKATQAVLQDAVDPVRLQTHRFVNQGLETSIGT